MASADSQEMLWDSAVFRSLMGGKGDSLLALPDTGSRLLLIKQLFSNEKKKKKTQEKIRDQKLLSVQFPGRDTSLGRVTCVES